MILEATAFDTCCLEGLVASITDIIRLPLGFMFPKLENIQSTLDSSLCISSFLVLFS